MDIGVLRGQGAGAGDRAESCLVRPVGLFISSVDTNLHASFKRGTYEPDKVLARMVSHTHEAETTSPRSDVHDPRTNC
jgi:hypothetical protein